MVTEEYEGERIKTDFLKRKNLFDEMIKNENFDRLKLREINMIESSYAGGHQGIELFPDIILDAYVIFFSNFILFFLGKIEKRRIFLFLDH